MPRATGAAIAYSLILPTLVLAAERHIMEPRVPMEKLDDARALKSPLPDSPEVVEKGKMLYRGKGTCVNCHGTEGRGDGPAAAGLDPSPRNFRHHGFWRHRTDGEIFWVIKHGSPGTSMISFGGLLSDEEIWQLIQYERTFGGRMGPMGPRRGMGPPEGMGHLGPPRGPMGGRGECCEGR